MFKLIEFADFGNFENNFTADNVIYLNSMDGLFIVTGENSDLFYHYSNSKHTMNKRSKSNDNHSRGRLIYIGGGNCILCISGNQSKKVEKYVNDDIITPFF